MPLLGIIFLCFLCSLGGYHYAKEESNIEERVKALERSETNIDANICLPEIMEDTPTKEDILTKEG